MNIYAIIAVGVGAAVGAWARWGLGSVFNPYFFSIPLGTLLANLIGGYLVGVAIEYFTHHSYVSAEVRLLVLTGFLGGLTTFSTFSAETITLLTKGEYGWTFAIVGAHVGGSIVMTLLGIFTIRWMHA